MLCDSDLSICQTYSQETCLWSMVKFKPLSESQDFGKVASVARSLAALQYFKALLMTTTVMGIDVVFDIV